MDAKGVKSVLTTELNKKWTRASDPSFQKRLPLYFWGPAGVGKSDVHRQVAAENSVTLVDCRASQLDPTDIRGVIYPQDGRAIWLAPDWFPTDPASRGIIFLDELNLAAILVQSSCYQLILDRRIGDRVLPDGWVISAAGNRRKHGAPAHKMALPLKNRFIHIDFDPSVQAWNRWAIIHSIHPDIIAFLNFKTEVFCPAVKIDSEEDAFPSPRTWAYASNVLYSYTDVDVVRELLSGGIGKGASAELFAFIRVKDELPNIDDILAGKSVKVDYKKPDVLYALMTTLAIKSTTPVQYKAVFDFIKKMPKDTVEFQVLALTLIGTKDRAATQIPEWKEWVAKHIDIFVG